MAENDAPVPDKNDFTEHYNTPLSAPEQDSFNGWMQDQSDKTGRNVGNELKDYDLQGWWQAHIGDTEDGPQLGQGHLTDEFKKPNHPTFSDESKYHGVAGNEGGHWEQMPGVVDEEHGPQYSFKTGATNLEHRTPEELQDYFNKVEEGNQLKLPGALGAQPDWAHAGDPRYKDGGGPQAPEVPVDFGAPGHIDRSRIRSELEQNPALADRLNQMVRGEVGDHASPEVRRIQMETAMNRALARGHSLEQALWDTAGHGNAGYYPHQSFTRGGFDKDTFGGDLEAVLSGSNYAGKYGRGLITGNASADVARHQFAKGTPGFTLETGSGPESYFSKGPFTDMSSFKNAHYAGPGDPNAAAAQQAGEVAAARMRRSVQPDGGRREGAATAVATHFIPTAIQGVVSSAMAGPKAMADVSSGELDPLSPEGIGAARNIALGTMGRPALKPGLGGTVVVPGAKEIAKTAAKPEREEEPKREPPPRLPDVSEMALSKRERVPKRFKDMRT